MNKGILIYKLSVFSRRYFVQVFKHFPFQIFAYIIFCRRICQNMHKSKHDGCHNRKHGNEQLQDMVPDRHLFYSPGLNTYPTPLTV